MNRQARQTISFTEVAVGDALPELSIEITPTLVIAGAVASRDFTPVHHDRATARGQGLQDVIMNTLTSNGLVGRFVTDWTGPDATLKAVRLKLGAPNLPGDTMKFRGSVTSKDESRNEITLSVEAQNSWGDHATGTVTVALPDGA